MLLARHWSRKCFFLRAVECGGGVGRGVHSLIINANREGGLRLEFQRGTNKSGLKRTITWRACIYTIATAPVSYGTLCNIFKKHRKKPPQYLLIRYTSSNVGLEATQTKRQHIMRSDPRMDFSAAVNNIAQESWLVANAPRKACEGTQGQDTWH